MTLEQFAKTHKFKIKNKKLYQIALTHPSYNQDANTKHQDYERMEYMGDSVLGYTAADIIYKTYGEMNPGDMSKLRSLLVRTDALAKYARKCGIPKLIVAGKAMTSEMISKSDHILENVFESLVCAIYLDNGIQVAYNYVASFIKEELKNINVNDLTDAKTRLQEEMQAEYRSSVHYVLVSSSGPAHDKTFKVNVLFNDIVLASGIGKSKKAAEEDAAKNALKKRSV